MYWHEVILGGPVGLFQYWKLHDKVNIAMTRENGTILSAAVRGLILRTDNGQMARVHGGTHTHTDTYESSFFVVYHFSCGFK